MWVKSNSVEENSRGEDKVEELTLLRYDGFEFGGYFYRFGRDICPRLQGSPRLYSSYNILNM